MQHQSSLTPAVTDLPLIHVFSPSSCVRDKAAFRRGVQRLKKLGHQVQVDEHALKHHMRFAGTDEERLAAILRAAHSQANVAIISRGGYGLTRILDQLPFEAIHQSIANGMRWVGFSDFTAFQLAVLTDAQKRIKSGQVMAEGAGITWAGPAVGEDFGADPRQSTLPQPLPDDIMEDCYSDLVSGASEGCGWQLSRSDRQSLIDSKIIANTSVSSIDEAIFICKSALLWGGNLSVVNSLLAGPHWPDVDQGVLFLEDANEHPYRVERMLHQLLSAGVLQKQQAIVLGAFSGVRSVPGYDRGFDMKTVVQELRTRLGPKVPVLTGMPFGHVPTKVCVPVGAKVDVVLAGRDVLFWW